MNMIDRFFRVVKSNVNEVIKNLEDPEKILEQVDIVIIIIIIIIIIYYYHHLSWFIHSSS